MNIFRFEVKKLLCSKMLIFLLLLCAAVNFFVLYDGFYNSDSLEIVSDIISETGIEINEASIRKLNEIYDRELDNLAKISPAAAKSYDENGGVDYSKIEYTSGVMEQEYMLMLINIIKNQAESAVGSQRKEAAAEQFFDKIGSTDSDILKMLYAAELILVADNDFAKEFFAPVSADYIHSVVFGRTITVFLTEMMFLAMFITVRSYTYEFVGGTQQLVYTTRRGRDVQKDKLKASVVAVSSAYVILGAVTFCMYFLINDMKEFLFVKLSSTAYGSIFTMADLSFFGLLGLCMLLGFVLSLIWTVCSHFICGFIKNPFGAIGVFVLLQVVCLIATNGMYSENISLFDKLLTASPIGLIMHFSIEDQIPQAVSSSLFCVTSNSIPFFELFTVILWMFICAVFGIFARRCFNRKEL